MNNDNYVTKEDNEYLVKIGEEITTNYKICTDDCISKKQLISFLEDKIKYLKNEIKNHSEITYTTFVNYCNIRITDYQEVLDFVNKGGKK